MKGCGGEKALVWLHGTLLPTDLQSTLARVPAHVQTHAPATCSQETELTQGGVVGMLLGSVGTHVEVFAERMAG